MLKDNRLYYTAIGGCLAAFLLVLSPPVYSQGNGSSGQESPSNIAAQPPSPVAPVTPTKIESPIERIARALEAANADNNSSEKADHDKADLRAQRNMARWAKWMFWVAFGQAIFSAIGIAFIWYSLKLNREATNAAIKAAEAADRAVEITAQTAERQLRAYISIEADKEKKPLFAISQIRIWLKAHNRGQTPAYKFQHHTIIRVSEYPLTKRLFRKKIQRVAATDLGPGADLPFPIEHNIPLTEAERFGLTKRTHRIYIDGVAIYRDAFGKRRYIRYCYTLPVDGNGVGRGIEIYHKYNKSN